MSKNKTVTISPITCSKGHTFYPKVLPDGTINIPDKCMIRSCRVYLDKKRVQKGIETRLLNLKLHHTKVNAKLPDRTFDNVERPRCSICNLTFYDQQNLITHNKRLHQRQ